ncbi:MAG: aminoglycoside phosphotransferase family protein, partial [Firmicutes bacterium]|nr:aminoglycoside phosphotransferase family protein [Bacillota bacterium]
MANEEFIQKLHKGFNFPLDTLRDYIKANTGLDVSGFTKITKGYDSEVYDIGRHMVKIRREGEVAYCCIEWAVEKCKEQNVKVPNIIHRGKIAEGDTLLDILIEEKIPGYPLTPNLYKEAGAQLKKIHSIKVDGFWRRRENGKFDFATYKDIALSATCNRLSEMPLIRAGNVFDDRHVECMKNALYQAEKLNVTPVLCHGDYAPKHILCETSINGIIDFGEFSGGSGYVDLAYFSLNSD